MLTKLPAVIGRACLVCFLVTASACKKNTAQAVTTSTDTLEDAVRETLDFGKFDKSKLDDQLTVVVAAGGGRQFFKREDIESFHAEAKKQGEAYETSDFKVLQRDESSTSRYASITYEVTWKASMAEGATSSHVVSHEIWERQVDGWHRMFAAIDQ
jgi:hypothetical protein